MLRFSPNSLRTLSRFLTVVAAWGWYLQAVAAQSIEQQGDQVTAIANPPGFSYRLATKTGQKVFHLGEMIEMEESLSSSIPDSYLLLQNPRRVPGGSSSALTILPSDRVIDRAQNTGRVSAYQILHADCSGSGGSAGGCGDCDGVIKLGASPTNYDYVLNYHFALTAPGIYTIQARARNVVLSNDPREPLPTVSTLLVVEIVSDENWSHLQLQLALEQFARAQQRYLEKGGGSDEVPANELLQETETSEQMEKWAETIRFLNTDESLRESVRLFDGSDTMARHENAFLKAIVESPHRDLAVSLLSKRMTDEDFAVSENLVDLLTAMTIQTEQPVVFERTDLDSLQQLNPRTTEILRSYVLALGQSLPAKHGTARDAALAAFRGFASQEYCNGQPLLEPALASKLLEQAQAENTSP
jgi:hypothetical protein